MVTIPKCQAYNRAKCADSKCPEQQGFKTAYLEAAKNKDYNAYAEVKQIEEARRKQIRSTESEPKLYHNEIGFPTNFTPPQGKRQLKYSQHAKREAENDRYGKIDLPSTMNFSDYSLIEIGMTTNEGRSKVDKMLYRGKLDDLRDLCVVVIPSGNSHEPWFVKTVWVNEASDSHRTLNHKKYETPIRQKIAA